MRSIKDYLAEAILLEANVANVDAIDAYVGAYMKTTPLPQGKVWLKKKLRGFLLNNTDFLTPIDAKNRPPGLPAYAVQALDAGQEVFVFDAHAIPGEFTQSLQHVMDWFDAMHRTIEAGPDEMSATTTEDFRLTQKEAEKLQKVTIEQITATADAWFNHMGTRLRGVEKTIEGVEVVHRWADGYYVVRYTDPQVMRMDGRDLQNCLQHGNYWDAVESGRDQVFGIRKPNDEAVVGIRTTKNRYKRGYGRPEGVGEATFEWVLTECKGKANRPPIPTYIPYVIDVLKLMKTVDISGNADLNAAGVFFRDGTFGSFDDISEIVYHDGGTTIRRTDDRFQVVANGKYGTGTITDNTVSGGAFKEFGDREITARLLTALGLPPTTQYRATLAKTAIYYQEGKFGTPRTIGTPKGSAGGLDLYEVVGSIFAYSGEQSRFMLTTDERGTITDLIYQDADNPVDEDEELAPVLNLLGRKITLRVEVSRLGACCWNGEEFGALEQVGTQVHEDGRRSLWQLGRRKMWVANINETFIHIGQVKGSLKVVAEDADEHDRYVAPFVRWLAVHTKPSSVTNPDAYGVINLRQGGAIADKAGLFEKLPALSALLKGKKRDTLQYDPDCAGAKSLLTCLRGTLVQDAHEHLSKPELRKLYEAFRADPASPLYVEELTTNTLFDLTITMVRFHFPMALIKLYDELSEIPPKTVKAEMAKALSQAMDYLKTNPHLNVMDFRTIDSDVFEELGLSNELSALGREIRAHRTASDRIRQERETNTDKYATDLSSRFAAMNAIRKSRS